MENVLRWSRMASHINLGAYEPSGLLLRSRKNAVFTLTALLTPVQECLHVGCVCNLREIHYCGLVAQHVSSSGVTQPLLALED